MPNFVNLSKIYLAIIWYDRLLCRELDVPMAMAFGKTRFSKFVIFVFLSMKINFKLCSNFHIDAFF